MKVLQRYSAALLAFLLLSTTLSPLAYAAPESTVVYIGSADELMAFSKHCTLDRWSQGKTVYLTADINLTNHPFSPIPTFGGQFDGQGYCISGLDVRNAGSNQGLFRYLQKGGVVRSLSVRGNVSPSGSGEAIGGIVGNNAGTLLDCKFYGSVKGKVSVGGLVGLNRNTGQISGGLVEGSVQGETSTGGICGRNLGSVLNSTNSAGINTASPDPSRHLEDLDVGAVIDNTLQEVESESEDSLKDHNDSGGIVGRSSGLVQGCHNTGAVGYPHVGYNVGGVIGRQTGFVQTCSNSGLIQGRKDVGGVVGQAEPTIILNASTDKLEELRQALDSLNASIHQALDHADASNATISARLTGMGNCADAARDSSKVLLDSVGDFADSNVTSLNSMTASIHQALDDSSPAFDDLAEASTTFSRLSDELKIALDTLGKASDSGAILSDEAAAAAEALRPVGDAVGRAAEDMRKATDQLGKALVIRDEAALATAIGNLGKASADLGTAFNEAGNALQALRNAISGTDLAGAWESLGQLGTSFQNMGSALSRLGGAVGSINTNVSVDWQQLRAALSNISSALGDVSIATSDMDRVLVHLRDSLAAAEDTATSLKDAMQQLKTVSSTASELGESFRSAFDTMSKALDRLTAEEPVEFYGLGESYEQASDDLYASFVTLSDEMSALNQEVSQAGETLTADLRTISNQLNHVFQLLIDSIAETREDVEEFDIGDYIEDTSDEDISATCLGKIATSWNAGTVEGDRNVGGLVGAMAIEHSLDPEDDVLPQPSLYKTYQSKAVLQACKNYGSITSKKDCVGGLAGRMDLGTVIFAQNYGQITSSDGDFVGGIAGYSSSTIRSSFAKCTLSGGDRIGGIAGEGNGIRDCHSIVTVQDGGECLGAIAGFAPIENGHITGNRYLDTGLAAVDGVSYANYAEAAEYTWFQAQAQIPPEFLSFVLTLHAQDRMMAQIPFQYDTNPNDLVLPEPPAQDGYYATWPTLRAEDLQNNLSLEAVYTPWLTVLESEEQSGSRALALVDGRFTEEATLHVTNSALTPPTVEDDLRCEVWDIRLTDTDSTANTSLRLLDSTGEAELLIYENGNWVPVEGTRNGNYLLCSMQGDSASFCLVSDGENHPPMLLFFGIPALLLVLVVLYLYNKKKHKAQSTVQTEESETPVS